MVKNCSIRFLFLAFFSFLTCSISIAQNRDFDRLEQLYSQQLYKIVNRKSKTMMSEDKFSFSLLPEYYFSLTNIQRAQNMRWFRKHKKEFYNSFKFLIDLKKDKKGILILNSHQYELLELKISVDGLLTNFNLNNFKEDYNEIKSLLYELTMDIQIEEENLVQFFDQPEKINEQVHSLISKAEEQLGIPYVFGGEDPKGFDCSGFTKFVYASIGIQIPRIAKDQCTFSKKIRQRDVQIGDLVFFTHGGPIAHVGLIYNVKNEELIMIHASSSKGIQIISLTNSKYWSSRIAGFGKIL